MIVVYGVSLPFCPEICHRPFSPDLILCLGEPISYSWIMMGIPTKISDLGKRTIVLYLIREGGYLGIVIILGIETA